MQTRRSKYLTTTVPPKRHAFRFEIFDRAITKRDIQIDQGTYHPKRSPSFISTQRHGSHEPAVRSTMAASENTASADTPLDIRCERGPPPPKKAGVDISQQALDAIEQDLIIESQSKLDPAMVDIRPHPSLSSADREAIEKIYESLLKEIRDETTEIGKIWYGIASHRPDAKEKPLSDLLVRLKKIIGQRIAAECRGSIEQAAQLYNSLGDVDMRDGDVPNANKSSTCDQKLDLLVHGIASELDDDVDWARTLTFGVINSSSAADLRDFLVGQLLRYEVSSASLRNTSLSAGLYDKFPYVRSASSNRIIPLPVARAFLRYVDQSFAYGILIQYGSVPRPATVSRIPTILGRSSISSPSSAAQNMTYPSNGSHGMERSSIYKTKSEGSFLLISTD